MRKYSIFFILISILIISTGCEDNSIKSNDTNLVNTKGLNSLTCIQTENSDRKKEDTMKVYYDNDNKVIIVENINISEQHPQAIDTSYSFGNVFANILKDVEGISVNYSKESDSILKSTIVVDYTKLNTEKLKENLKDLFTEDKFYYFKDINLNDFKTKYLEEYNCK